MTVREAAREAARRLFADDECEVDGDARVSLSEGVGTSGVGAWVQCWRYVSAEVIDRVVEAAGEGHPEGTRSGADKP